MGASENLDQSLGRADSVGDRESPRGDVGDDKIKDVNLNVLGSIFESWDNISSKELTLADRSLISIIFLDYLGTDGADGVLTHVRSYSPEMRRAIMDRSDRLLADFQADNMVAAKDQNVDELWLKAIRSGIQANMQETSLRQLESMNSLKAYVEKQTGMRAQFLMALAGGFFVAVLVGLARYAVTIFD